LVDARTPVLVGVGQVTQREDDPTVAVEALALMARAARVAGDDAGAPGLLQRVGWIGVPRGTWGYADAGRLLAAELAPGAARPPRTVVADVGVLQQSLLTAAATAIQAGDVDVALVVGGEAKHRALRAQIAGVAVADTEDAGATPDVHMTPKDLGVTQLEIARGAVTPVVVYALVESALRAAAGRTPAEHRDHLARLWGGFAAVAAANPHAWDRSGPDGAAIVSPAPRNRLLAAPYTKLLASQWNVDQAAALLLCSYEAARAAGVPDDRLVFPLAATESNRCIPVPERTELHRVPAAGIAGRAALDLAGVDVDAVTRVDLYSCFPAAVQTYAAELGIALDPVPTVTGGMTFGGGPFNNYVLQSTAAAVAAIRADGGGTALVSSVSGFVHKQGFGIWSTTPPADGFRAADLTARAEAEVATTPSVDGVAGPATIVGCTAVADGQGVPHHGLAIVDLADGRRSLVTLPDPAVAAAMVDEEWIGRAVQVAEDGTASA
jgi:acetyl-CoA C-acetyltransferase